MKLRSVVEGKNGWCGPAVISSITGFPVDHVVETIRKVRENMGCEFSSRWVAGKDGEYYNQDYRLPVKGMYDGEVRYTLQRYGYNLIPSVENVPRYNKKGLRPTLAQWLKARGDRNEMNLISAGHHYQLVKGVKLVDNATKDPVFISKAPHRRRRMKKVYKVVKIESRKQLVYRKPK